MKKLIFAMAVVAAGAASAVSFSYQGALKTKTGENLPANERNKTIEFRLYETPTGEDGNGGADSREGQQQDDHVPALRQPDGRHAALGPSVRRAPQ